ncbi:MAG: hypothetical protein IKA99_02440, partial [Clostridia bacterium]|nr:hypothetical protein [Clostridia bacterium]
SGSGSGYGSGDGDGSKIVKLGNDWVFYIDEIPTIIRTIRGNFARGYTISDDYQLTPCVVAKDEINGYFAHGKTVKEAYNSLQEKICNNMTLEQKITLFTKTFDKKKKYKGTEFFKWHNLLTGSCLFGRKEFVKNKGLDLEQTYTVLEFISLTKTSYGGSIISKLSKYYEVKDGE